MLLLIMLFKLAVAFGSYGEFLRDGESREAQSAVLMFLIFRDLRDGHALYVKDSEGQKSKVHSNWPAAYERNLSFCSPDYLNK